MGSSFCEFNMFSIPPTRTSDEELATSKNGLQGRDVKDRRLLKIVWGDGVLCESPWLLAQNHPIISDALKILLKHLNECRIKIFRNRLPSLSFE